jgi:adenylate kinase family enzyme
MKLKGLSFLEYNFSGSKEGLKIKSLVDKGHIVPTEITVGLLLKTIKSTRASVKSSRYNNLQRFLIDGFPRGLEQAFFLEQQFRELDFIINFDVPAEVLIDRLTKRALVSGRSDDNPETIKNRIEVFYEST